MSHGKLEQSLAALAFGGLVAGSAGASPAFVDVTASSQLSWTNAYGPHFSALVDQLLIDLHVNMGNGAAVGDYDGDGDLDLYLLGQVGVPNRLYRNDLPSKTFTDVTPPVLANLGMSRTAQFADLDGDGDPDLVLLNDDDGGTTYESSRIFRNDGGGSFTDVTPTSGFRPVGYIHAGLALADYDGNGLLDIYVTKWKIDFGLGVSFPGHNRLYRNQGGFLFQEVTGSQGLGALAAGSFSAIFTSFDADPEPEIFVAVDADPDVFYDNAAGHFSDATQSANTLHLGNDMGVAAADFDDDGDLDLYATNITDPGIFGTTQGNVLYVNTPDGMGSPVFTDEAVARGVDDTHWGWGVEFIDTENDGDLDLVAATGFDVHVCYVLQSLSIPCGSSYVYTTPSVLLQNDGTGHYSRLTGVGLDADMDSRSLIAFDYDRDGDQDLLIVNVNQSLALFENTSTGQGHWLDVSLGYDALAFGAQVHATTGSTTRRRDLVAGDSFLAGTPPEVHFGLGTATVVDTLRIVWADGVEQILTNVPVNQQISVQRAPTLPALPAWAFALAALSLLGAGVAASGRSRGPVSARLGSES